MATRSPRQQLDTFSALIEGKRLDRSSPTFTAALEWMSKWPGELDPYELEEFKTKVARCWGLNPTELEDAIAMAGRSVVEGNSPNLRYSTAELRQAELDEEEFDALVPPSGFFRDYLQYTKESEAPIAYHFFCAVVGLAAITNRRTSFAMGPTGKIYPPLGIILIGPSGIKKTSSADILVGILMDTTLVPLYSEKVTPEALVEGMSKGQAVGLVYAPEMAVFLNRQTYNEGLVPILTRLMDSPDKWTSATISRGARTLIDVALTSLMCSTSDWFIGNTPKDMFGGGFIARNLIIHQEISPRIIPIPKARDEVLRNRLIETLVGFHETQGEMHFDKVAYAHYVQFYRQNKMFKPEHDMLEAYFQRKANHAIRISMLLHLATHRTYEICDECFERALAILAWTERFMPSLLKQMFKTGVGEDAEKVLRVIRSSGGAIAHSTLVRKTQYFTNAGGLKGIVNTLKESGQLEENVSKMAHTYTLKEVE